MEEPSPAVLAARSRWQWVGRKRPPWAETPAPGQESVWDFPRPPRVEPVASRLRVVHAGRAVAETGRAMRIVETAGAPTYYFPSDDVDLARLAIASGHSFCEWKGAARHFDVDDATEAAWCYPDPFPEFAAIRGWMSFLPSRVDACWIGEARATPQPGGYYGGWVTPGLSGPIKGGAGSESW